jgi:8-oxo-dGTP pyrophosphatase MutT (NUDIX family)
MPHLHNQPGQHDLTASAFIARTGGPEPAILLHFHRKSGFMMQFGGHIELDENPWQGLIREIREESGYEPRQYSVLQPRGSFIGDFETSARHPLPMYFNTHLNAQSARQGEEHYHSDLTYTVVTAENPAHKISDGESADIQALTAAELRALPQSRIFDQTRANALFILEHLIADWEAVPATNWRA